MNPRTLTTTLAMSILVVLALAPGAWADGTETLGPPSASIASGTGVVAAGTGTFKAGRNAISKSFSVSVPAGATVKQVLLYWEGHGTGFADQHCYGGAPGFDQTISVNGNSVTGTQIGGPTNFFGAEYFAAYRTDITSLNLVAAGANTLTISDMWFLSCFGPYVRDDVDGNDGAGVLVVFEVGGSAAAIAIRDGHDMAYAGFQGALQTTVPQSFTFPASPVSRAATLSTLVASALGEDVPGPRTNQLRITFDVGTPQVIENPWHSAQGFEFDARNDSVTIPPGASSATVHAVSGPGENPSSLAWITAALSVPEVRSEPPTEAEARTIGYWKNWSSCTGGSQASILDQTLAGAGGISVSSKLKVTTCPVAVAVLNKSTINTQAKKARDAAFRLAAQLLAAKLNLARGAATCAAATSAVTNAYSLLSAAGFTGKSTWSNTMTPTQRTKANALAGALDSYNNNNLC